MSDTLNQLTDLLRYAVAQGADHADAIYFASTDVATSVRKGKPENLERAESTGIGLRVFVGQRPAMVSSTDLSQKALHIACERAISMAKASLDDPHSGLASPDVWPTNIPELDLCEPNEADIGWLQAQCKQVEETALSHDGITNSEGAEAHLSRNHIALATSSGFANHYQTSSCSLSVSVIAGEGDRMERDYAYSLARHTRDLREAALIGHEAATRTLRRMSPQKASSQSVPVIFEPRIARSLLSYFASATSGSAIARGTSFLKNAMGTAILSPAITIIDDPHVVRGLGSKPFDAEAVANGKKMLVEAGLLQSWLLDIRSANQLGLTSTGHAVRGIGSSPSPSSTNLYIAAGKDSPESLIAEIENGFYVTDAFGMGVNLITGDYSQGASGMWIENGKLAYPVSEVTIASHLSEMFKSLTPANDLSFDFATNSPTLRVDRMTVAGV